MKKIFSSFLYILLNLFCCIIYAFLMSCMVITFFNLDFCLFYKFFVVFYLGSFFFAVLIDSKWR